MTQTQIRNIKLASGEILEVECSDKFLQCIRQHFALDCSPTDDHIRLYIFGSVYTALQNVDSNEILNDKD
jgi:hypothetical protein